MYYVNYICIGFAIFSLMASIGIIIINRYRQRKTLNRMHKMLDNAVNGNFTDEVFDENVLSSVEIKLNQYLSSCNVSAKNLATEKDKISQFISDISHQTKTPIANILLYSQLLSEQNLSNESAQSVSTLAKQAEKLSFLISSLVKISRLESGVFTLNPTFSNVNTLLEDVENQIKAGAKAKNISLTIHKTTESAWFDKKWTTEAIYNIIDNAVKYTDSGGEINVSVIPYQLFCRIDITDNGIGIDEKEHAHIFTRFYRSTSVADSEGVGIGLYLARTIISDGGGYIKLSSQMGQGSTFSVFLPIV